MSSCTALASTAEKSQVGGHSTSHVSATTLLSAALPCFATLVQPLSSVLSWSMPVCFVADGSVPAACRFIKLHACCSTNTAPLCLSSLPTASPHTVEYVVNKGGFAGGGGGGYGGPPSGGGYRDGGGFRDRDARGGGRGDDRYRGRSRSRSMERRRRRSPSYDRSRSPRPVRRSPSPMRRSPSPDRWVAVPDQAGQECVCAVR